jgi:MFS family permease
VPTPGATVVALAVATSLALLGDLMLYTALPVHHEAAGISVAALGVILSVHRFIRLLANPVGGLVYDRLGRRRPFLAGLGLATLASLGYLLAQSFWPLLAARLVWGLAFSLISVGTLSILLDVTTPADRARTVGGFHALANVGRVLVFLASGWLVDAIGYRRTLGVFVPLTAVGGVVAWAVLRETRPAVGGEAPTPFLGSLRALDRRLLVPAAVGFATFFGGSGVLMATLGLHLREQAAGSGALVPLAALTGVLLAARQAVAIVAAPVAGRLADALGDRAAVAAAGAAIGVAGFATLATGRGLGAVVAGVVLVALGESVLLPPLTAWAGDLTPPALRGAAMGGLATANDLGGATGPLVGIALAGTAGLRAAYALAALFALAALALVLLGRQAGGGRTRPADA